MRVLVVDPTESNLELMRLILERAGLEVLLAMSGDRALEMVAQHSPQLVVTEMRVPEVSGPELIRALRASDGTRDTPIVVVSASVLEAERALAQEAGCDAFFPKPLPLGPFVHYVRDLLEKHQAA